MGAIKNRETQATLCSRHRTDTICFKYWKQKIRDEQHKN